MTREEAITYLKVIWNRYKAEYEIERETLDAYHMAIEALSADAEQGEWIIHGEPPWLVRECSECGAKWYQWSGDKTPNYCGNCGARMEATNEL